MRNLPVKKNDMVVVLSGEDRGKIGKVLMTFPEKGRVLVEGINVIKKALRKSQDNPKGGIITKEGSIHVGGGDPISLRARRLTSFVARKGFCFRGLIQDPLVSYRPRRRLEWRKCVGIEPTGPP